jgi:hypothetical protein
VIHAPSDPHAQKGTQRETTGLGYNAPVTETCGLPEDQLHPQLSVRVQSTVAPVPDADQPTCPQGQIRSRLSRTGKRMEMVCAAETCARCPVRQDWTRSQTTGRVLHVRPQPDREALQA